MFWKDDLQLSDEKLAKALMEMPDGKRANVLGLIK